MCHHIFGIETHELVDSIYKNSTERKKERSGMNVNMGIRGGGRGVKERQDIKQECFMKQKPERKVL